MRGPSQDIIASRSRRRWCERTCDHSFSMLGHILPSRGQWRRTWCHTSPESTRTIALSLDANRSSFN